MNSAIMSVCLHIWTRICNLINDSLIGSLIKVIANSFKKATEASCIINFFTKDENTDIYYKKSFTNKIDVLWNWIIRIFKIFHKGIKESAIIIFLKDSSSHFLYYPLRFYGVILLPIGVISLLASFYTGASRLTILAALLLSIISAVLILIKTSINNLIFESFFVNIVLYLFALDKHEKIHRVDAAPIGLGLGIGFVFGVLSIVTGLIPVIVALVLVIAACFVFSQTNWAVILFVGVLPFMPTMVMVAGSLAIAVCIAAKKVLGFNEHFTNYNSSVNLFVGIMGLVFLFGSLTSVTVISSLKISLVYIAFLIAYFIVVKAISTKQSLLNLITITVLSSFPVALYGIYQNFTGFDAENTWIDKEMFEEITGRVVSFFGNPNVFGEYLILLIMLCIAIFTYTKEKRLKIIYGGILASLGLSMIFTYSRGCWIGILIACAIFLFLINKKLFWSAGFLGFVSIFFLPDSIITRFTSIGNLSDSSTSYRVYIWEGTINMLKDFWITGIGLGTDAFNKIYPLYAFSSISAPHPHNLYLLILTETGVVGMITLIGLLFMYYKKLFFVIGNTNVKEYKTLAISLISAMTGFLVQGMFDNVWYNYRVFLLFWIFIAIGTVIYILSKREVNAKE